MSKLADLIEQLEAKIQLAYLEGVTVTEAEKLAAEFLYAQLQISSELAKKDLDARMKKTGVKAIKAATYMNAASAGEKKPTEAMLAATVDQNTIVQKEQDKLDDAEVTKAELERVYDVFLNAHIYFRGVAKGNFNA